MQEIAEKRNHKMKRIAKAIGVCALLLASAAASGAAFTWDGTPTSDWDDGRPWGGATLGSPYPGKLASGDTATINADTPNDTVIVSTTIPNDVAWVLVDAEAAGVDDEVDDSVDLTLKIDTDDPCDPAYLDVLNSGSGYVQVIAGSHTFTEAKTTRTWPDEATLWVADGTLNVDGTVTVQSSESVDADATIQVDSGTTFTPGAMKFDGSQTEANGHAIGIFAASVTVTESCDGTTDTCMEGYVDVTFTNSVTVDAKDLKIGDCGSSGNSGTVAVSGNGTLRACSFVMKGGSSVNSTLTVSDNASVETYDPS
jgi:hypothetical protein